MFMAFRTQLSLALGIRYRFSGTLIVYIYVYDPDILTSMRPITLVNF